MSLLPHIAIFTDNASRKMELARQLLSGRPPEELSFLNGRKGGLFSNTRIGSFLEEEARHDESGLLPDGGRKLATYSSGERKKALLRFLLSQSPDFLILDNVFDNLDRQFSVQLRSDLEEISKTIILIQFLSRAEDLLSFIRQKAFLHITQLHGFPDYKPSGIQVSGSTPVLQGSLPPAPSPIHVKAEILVLSLIHI